MTEKEIKENYSKLSLRYYTKGEEWANTISHALGTVFGIIALILMLLISDSPAEYASAVLFALGAIIVYGGSTFYHAVNKNLKLKSFLRKIDHAAINFLVISSGITLVLLTSGRVYNYVALAFGYAISILSYVLCIKDLLKFKTLGIILNFVTGALVVSVYFLNMSYIQWNVTAWFIAAMTLCLAGAVSYGIKVKYIHAVFHVLELLGTIAYFMANYLQILNH